jgi:glutaminyl-tRNA synthetase
MSNESTAPTNFIRQIIEKELAEGQTKAIHTRFPPEPNGYLHIGHAKSICLNFGLAEDYNGRCNLRFDDTNPHKEDQEYIDAIQEDIRWLGFDWGDQLFYSSDYFPKLYQFAVELIKAGKAYVCDLSAEEVREYRGSLTEKGVDSPQRNRSIDENLELFEGMKAGKFEDGSRTLRAKIDMGSPNINMRDPALYRIRHGVVHHQTGDAWCIYPMYDFTHPISDALEGINYSLCTLEFEDHRPFYDWILDNISVECHPRQIEFSRLNLEYTVVSKRKLTQLVDEKVVHGWDDPRMPTLAGLRRRGVSPASIKEFSRRIGVTKVDGTIEMGVLESCIREDLDQSAQRRMAVLNPLKVVITNYSQEQVEAISAPNHPKNEAMGVREINFSRELYIDRDDFRESANKKFKRLVLDKEVRLRNSYVIRCDQVIKDEAGEIVELRCSYDPETLGANPEGRKVKGVIHWVSAKEGVKAELRLYDRLFNHPTPDGDKEKHFLEHVNEASLTVISEAVVEPLVASEEAGISFQFEREGYYCVDKDSTAEKPVFNRVVTLRDSWAKIENSN